VIRSFVKSVNAQDWDSVRKLVVPQFVRHSNAGGVLAVRSAEELITYLKNEYVTFPDAKETLLDLVAEGESVAVRSHFSGAQLGSTGSYRHRARCSPPRILRSIVSKEGALAKRGPSGTTCMGCNSSGTLKLRSNPESIRFLPQGPLSVDIDHNQFACPSSDQSVRHRNGSSGYNLFANTISQTLNLYMCGRSNLEFL
jgi:hypothetical protein